VCVCVCVCVWVGGCRVRVCVSAKAEGIGGDAVSLGARGGGMCGVRYPCECVMCGRAAVWLCGCVV
jgi:hypothetical protein